MNRKIPVCKIVFTQHRFLSKAITLLVTCIAFCSFAGDKPSPATVDKTVAGYLQKIGHWRDNSQQDNQGDSLYAANDRLMAYLLSAAKNNPALLTAGLPKAGEAGMYYYTSADKKFRVYNWDSWTGGTMHFYHTIIQYATSAGTSAVAVDTEMAEGEEGGNPGYWYDTVYTVTTKTGNTFYLPVYRGRYSTKDWSMGIRAYAIENNRLNNHINLFYTKTKQLNEISFEYDLFPADNLPGNDMPVIHLSNDLQKLYIPVIGDHMNFTAKWLVYVFDGGKFVFDKNAK